MSSSLRRGVAAAALIALPLAALAACGAGTDAETGQVHPDNAYAEAEDIKIQNVNVVMPDGEDGPAGISARLFNNGADDQTLETVRVPGAGPVELTPVEGESGIVVPAGGSVALGGEGNPAAVIADPAPGSIRLGNAQRVVFDLSETGNIRLQAIVVSTEGEYEAHADWGPSATPEAEETDQTGETGEAQETQETEGTEGEEGTEGTEADEEAQATEGAGGAEGTTEDTEGVEGGVGDADPEAGAEQTEQGEGSEE